MTKQITRQQFLTEVQKKVDYYENASKKARTGTYALLGANDRLYVAMNLRQRLTNGGKPSNAETASYFGKGSRFTE